MTTSTQYAWEYVTSYLKGDIELAPGFEANLNILVNQHELSDILLQYFFKAANTNFMSISEQFQTIVHKMRADPHIIVPEAIQFANFHWVRWRNIGLQLSSCISRANNLTKAKDYTTEQLLASFNVALFETEDSAVVSSRRDRAAWRNKLNRPNRSLERRFNIIVETYFRDVFNETHRSAGFGDDEDEEDEDDMNNEQNEILMNTFSKVCSHLRSLCWVNRLESAFSSVLYEKLEAHIVDMCKQGEFEDPVLSQLDDWMERVALQWLRKIHAPDESNDDSEGNNAGYYAWTKRLRYHMYTTFGDIYIKGMFNIVKDYPETEAAILDLRECLKRTHQHRQLTVALRSAFDKRLLHPGAETNAILAIYVATIKALRLLDSTGVLLESVSQAIKNYLRGREDTIRKIVEHLTNPNDGGSELFRELVEDTGNALIQQDDDEDDEVAEDDDVEKKWMPDSIDADPNRSSKSRRLSDILSMLVQIYGSKKLFVTEYRTLLAKKLLKNTTLNTDQEVYTLERLKQRFGEASLHPCEIMMKDMADSRRINKGITANVSSNDSDGGGGEMKSIIISKEYWPKLHSDASFKLHPTLLEAHDTFAKQYSTLKAPRKLMWKHNLGIVNLDLTFNDDQSYNYQVSPLHATIILHLQDAKRWSVKSLCRQVGIQETALKKTMSLWINHGVVHETKNDLGVPCYEVVENYTKENDDDDDENGNNNKGGSGDGVNNDEDEMMVDSNSSLDFQMYENYVTMMLANFGELPLDGIHNKLTMFVMGGDQEITISQLRTFLKKLVSEEKIAFNGQCYTKV